MSFTGRITALNARHRTIDEEIQAEEQRAGADRDRIIMLKRQKLSIRDTLTMLQAHQPRLDGPESAGV